LDKDGSLFLMLLNPTGGLLGGDHLKTEVMLGPGAHVCLTTPSATKVYRTLGAPAVQETEITVDAGSVLEYFPDHVIPHPDSALHQTLTVEMNSGGRVILLDSFAVGRLARAERWLFTEMRNQVAISLAGRLIFLDRMHLVPSERIPAGLGQMGKYGYLATLIAVADSHDDWSALSRALSERLAGLPSIRGGVSLISKAGCVVRFLAYSAQELADTARALWDTTRLSLLGRPAPDLRKF
jgi:urease accessory protein